MVIAVYPGTFDPITKGHEDLIERSSKIFDKVLIAISYNPKKQPFFSIEERVFMTKKITSKYNNVIVYKFDGLLKTFIEAHKAQIIIRGLRSLSDFEYEFRMSKINKYLINHVETIFMTSSDKFQFISSTIVKELAQFDGNISNFVSPLVNQQIKNKIKKAKH